VASGCTFVHAGDKEGRIGDFLFLLSKRRDVMSAKRFFSQQIRPTIGFKRFDTATVTMRRMELAEAEKIKCNLESLIGKHATAPQTWAGRGVLLLVDFLGAEMKAALVTVVSVDAIATFAITAVSSSVLTSVASDFLIGGTLATTTTDTMDILTMTSLTTMRPYTITGIGTVWPARSKRILPGVVITTDRLTEWSALEAAKPFELFKKPRGCLWQGWLIQRC
jgi:hypothetical protein